MSTAAITAGDAGRLQLSGEVTFGSVPGLWNRYRDLAAQQADLDIDLAQVERADSAGLALLVACVREAHQTGKSIRFFNIPAQMLDIARVSSLDEVLPLHRDP